MKKSAKRDANTARWLPVRRSQKISPRRRPLPGAQDGQNLISCRRSLTSPTDRLVKIDARNFELSW